MSMNNLRRYEDADCPVDERIADLLPRMTVEEKIGQMMQLPARSDDLEDLVVNRHVGSILHTAPEDISRAAALVRERTRLHIPLLIGDDCIHGYSFWSGATIFPEQLGMAASWDPQKIEAAARATAEEVSATGVHWTFSPVLCIARDTRWGRVGETFGEDPMLIGEIASAMVRGYQGGAKAGEPLPDGAILACAKHFAGYSETQGGRDASEADLSHRKLASWFLPPFERVAKEGCATFMLGYESIDGVPVTFNHWLLTDVLRDEWGFSGIVMSDWGAAHDRVASLNAGLNLEMPPSYTDDEIVRATKDGRIHPAQLDRMASGMIDLVNKTREAMSVEGYRFDAAAHNEIARRAAVESMVLLKNEEGILPLDPDSGARMAVIGEFARTPRYQGGGSSHITPTMMASFLDALADRGVRSEFAPGFTLDLGPGDPGLESQAVETARRADVVLMFMGLPEAAESEGFDRESLDMPAKQIALLERVASVNPNVVVVLSNGSVVSIVPWARHAKGILESWLLGQAGGTALADVVLGKVSPSGKLALTIPMDIRDDPSMLNWPGEEGHVDYGEGVFVGYRYYDTFGKDVDYPFGFGLGYAEFDISDVTAERTGANTARVTATVINVSSVAGSETVQVYVAPRSSHAARPRHELKDFAKVFLDPGQSRTVSVDLDERSFAYWSERFGGWHVESGEYGIEVGSSSRDIAATVALTLEGDGRAMPLTEWSTYGEWSADPVGARVVAEVAEAGESGGLATLPDNSMMRMFLMTMPINSMPMLMGEAGRAITAFMLRRYAEIGRIEADRTGTARTGTAHAEAGRDGAGRDETGCDEIARSESARSESARSGLAHTESARAETRG